MQQFHKELTSVHKKLLKADDPIKFINSIINKRITESIENSYIIPPNSFEEGKSIVMIETLYLEENEKKSSPSQKVLQFTVYP